MSGINEHAEAVFEAAERGPTLNPATHRVIWPSGYVFARDKFGVRGPHGWRIEDGKPIPHCKMTLWQAIGHLRRNGMAGN